MPNINDRIGSQNVIRVLSNATGSPSKIVNLVDVDSTLKAKDGLILVWDVSTETFYMTDTIDSSSIIATGIVSFTNTRQSTSTTTGAVIVSGGVAIAKNLNVGGDVKIVGIVTFGTSSIVIDGNSELMTVGSGVTISSSGGITTPSIKINGPLSAETINISGVSTFASLGGITTTGGDLYVGSDLYVGGDLYVVDDLRFDEFTARNANITGITTVVTLGITGLTTTKNLIVTGISTFQNNVNVTGFVTVTEGLYYDFGDYDGPNGVAYFDNTGKLIGAASTENAITTSNFILTTDYVGIPTWTSVIDGGDF